MNAYEKKLIALYLRAETDIINEIARLRSRGLADYHAVAALRRVRRILAAMQSEAWTYVPKAIEAYFYYAIHPDRRTMRTTVQAALGAYEAAMSLTAEQTDVAGRLVLSLMAQLEEASQTVTADLESYLVGRRDFDTYRKIGLAQSALIEAEGRTHRDVDRFVKDLQRNGITAFRDRAGRRWRLHTYCAMVTRTTTRQAEVLSVLTSDPEQDLFTITGAADPCGLCAPYQNRVYSRSGQDKRFPPLADAFGKIDLRGPDTLANTWLNIHPNCRCAVVPWTEAGLSALELEEIRRFSDPKTNPYNVDPRSKKAIEAYRKKEAGRAKWLSAYDQWQRYRVTIPDKTPKTFQTFLQHKLKKDEKYRQWEQAYRAANRGRGDN